MRRRHYKKGAFTFGSRPMLYHSRSQFDLSFHHKTSLNASDLIPFYCQEILPGDSFKVNTSMVARVTSALLKPVMDNAFLDTYYFFVPNRLVLDTWQQVMGENTESAWAQPAEVDVPLYNGTSETVAVGSIADYLGIPSGLSGSTITADGGISLLPFRAYALIYDQWFRDENTQDPILVNTSGEQGSTEVFNGNPFGPNNYFGMPAKINKVHDLYTSCLPAPQKGSPVSLGVSLFPQTSAPVVTTGDLSQDIDPANKYPIWFAGGSFDGGAPPRQLGFNPMPRNATSTGNLAGLNTNLTFSWYAGNSNGAPYALGNANSTGQTGSGGGFGNAFYPVNLWAQIPETAIQAGNVNDLRFAFQLQKMLEKDARGGTRYTEYLREHFGVISPDARLQRTEFLGGKRMPLSVFQVAQTSQATDDSPLAQVGAFSLSSGHNGYTKGFVEHGFVIGVCAIRQFHTYQQGIEEFWFRSKRTDFYEPVFANIGEQPIYTRSLYAGVGSDETVFGYNEAWADYRYRPSRISGQLRSSANEGLDVWHFADQYSSAPVLGSEFIQETDQFIDRTLALPSSTVNQFILDIYCKQKAIRVMPTYSIPGLIDHH